MQEFPSSWQQISEAGRGFLDPRVIQLLEERDEALLRALATSMPVVYTLYAAGLESDTWSAPTKVVGGLWTNGIQLMDDPLTPYWYRAVAGGAVTLSTPSVSDIQVGLSLVPHNGTAPSYPDINLSGITIDGGTTWILDSGTQDWPFQEGRIIGSPEFDLYMTVTNTTPGCFADVQGTVTLYPARGA